MKKINYDNETIELFKKDPRIKYIDSYELRFTLEFRQELYDLISPNFCESNIKQALNKLGIDTSRITRGCIRHLCINFKKRRPCGAKNKIKYQHILNILPDASYNSYLLSTPYFEKGRKGISPTIELYNSLYSKLPKMSVEDTLKSLDIDINKLGYQRIYLLQRRLESSNVNSKSTFSDEQINHLKANPYVKKITKSTLIFNDNFYNEAYVFKDYHIDEILNIFEIDPSIINYDRKNNIKYKINSWQEKECLPIDGNIELLIKVETNKYNKLLSMGNETIKAFKSYLASCDCLGRKMICHMIKELAEDSNCFYSTRSILKLFGMGKSSYYHILKDNDYGKYKALKIEQDKKDIEKIKEVINVNKYPKGRRMIYMLLDKNNNHMSMNKIARLCHKFNITCRVRKHNKSRKVARDLLTRNCKENLVKRRFKLCKPGEITLTDISYLKCPFGTVYLSALKDSSSGIVKLLISKNNNLNLALDTLKGLPVINNSHNKMFHSDQGILYLNDTFQNKLKELGYIQSMSKRGNCWDNSSQESFFGHMKDEVDFTKCHNIDDVIKEIKDYEYYYNYKRPQWNRNKMTPIEFATYINNMSDAEYEKYYNSELEKYNIMIENATLKAINRAKNIGI